MGGFDKKKKMSSVVEMSTTGLEVDTSLPMPPKKISSVQYEEEEEDLKKKNENKRRVRKAVRDPTSLQ